MFPYGNTEFPRVEVCTSPMPAGVHTLTHLRQLGGSIFVDVNKNMMRAANEFNLELIDSDFNHKHELGIWDGQQFVFRVRPTALCSARPELFQQTENAGIGAWWGKLGALWRYGYSAPQKAAVMLVRCLLVGPLRADTTLG